MAITRLQLTATLGSRNAALALLDSLIQAKRERMLYVACPGEDPSLAPLRGDPRWSARLAKMGVR